MKVKKCKMCKKVYEPPKYRVEKAQYCSSKCASNSSRKRRRENARCGKCGTAFEAVEDHGKMPKYCSRDCFLTSKHDVPVLIVKCKACKAEFEAGYAGTGKRRMYCSVKCRNDFLRQDQTHRPCVICGDKFILRGTRNNQKCCSRECQYKHYAQRKSKAWKGGRYVSSTGMVYVNVKGIESFGGREYYAEHRLVAEARIGRRLLPSEPIIHVDMNKENNAEGNLYVCQSLHAMQRILKDIDPFPLCGNLGTYK